MAELTKEQLDLQTEEEFKLLNPELGLLKREEPNLKYPLGATERLSIDISTTDMLMDAAWNKYFYYSTFFESLDGFINSGTGSGVVSQAGIVLTTGATADNAWTINKAPEFQRIINWLKPQKMRSTLSINQTAGVTASIVTGLEGADQHFGFKVINGTLYGVCGETSQSTLVIGTVVAATNYDLEAHYLPGVRVSFYVNENYFGDLNTNLPIGGTSGEKLELMEIKIKNTDGAPAKILRVSFFEYIQSRLSR